ncbi:MAG: hypothetical protein HY002_06750 [Candidatus Rokubacteria bacterium]|nr:hypothetical protein [Candidatus Rokubacteria bacterium]
MDIAMGSPDDALEDRLDAVARYLQEEFPDRRVLTPVRNVLERIYAFTLPGNPPHFVSVSEEFLNDHPAPEIATLLLEWALGSMLRTTRRRRVIVTTAGLGFGPM